MDRQSSPNTRLSGAKGGGNNLTQVPHGKSLSASRPPQTDTTPSEVPIARPSCLRSATTPLSPAEQVSPIPSDVHQEDGILTTWSQVQEH